MNILILTQYFFPEERTAPTNLFNLSIDLVNKGHSVTVLTGIPNHPYGHYYKGYKLKLWQKEIIDGVEILRVPLFPDHSMSVLKRTLGYLSFSLSAVLIGPYLLRNKKLDVIFTYLPPLTIGIPARLLSVLKRAPIVYWMTDLWPENLIATGKKFGRIPIYFIKRFESWVYNIGRKITVNSPGFMSNLISKNVDKNKISIISDWVDPNLFYPTEFRDDLAINYNLKNKFNIIYAGNLGKVQGIHHLINAVSKLQNDTNVQLVLIGDGTEVDKLKQIVTNNNIKNVVFISKKPFNIINQYLALADVLVLHLIDTDVFRMQMPSKLIAYMACEKPILCAFEGTAAEIVKNSGCGLTCQSSNELEISKKMQEFYEMDECVLVNMGSKARVEYLRNYTREIQTNITEKILQDNKN